MKIIDFWSSEGQLGAQICIGKALGIRFWGSGGLLDTERRPGEPQGGLQEFQKATRRTSRRSSRTPKLRSIKCVKWLLALKKPLAAPKELPRSFLRAKMTVKVAQKSSTEPVESSENDLKMKNLNVHKIIEKSMKIIDFWSSEGQLWAQICIGKALGIRFWGSGGLLDTERRPGELQGGPQ